MDDDHPSLDALFEPDEPGLLPDAVNDIQFTLAMLTDRMDFMERMLAAIQQDVRTCTQWITRDERA